MKEKIKMAAAWAVTGLVLLAVGSVWMWTVIWAVNNEHQILALVVFFGGLGVPAVTYELGRIMGRRAR